MDPTGFQSGKIIWIQRDPAKPFGSDGMWIRQKHIPWDPDPAKPCGSDPFRIWNPARLQVLYSMCKVKKVGGE